jgi:hypothetical protein
MLYFGSLVVADANSPKGEFLQSVHFSHDESTRLSGLIDVYVNLPEPDSHSLTFVCERMFGKLNATELLADVKV